MNETKPNFGEYQRANIWDIPAAAAGGVLMVAEFVVIIGGEDTHKAVTNFVERQRATAAAVAFHLAPFSLVHLGRRDTDHSAAW
ncbi:MAG TPA: hypothetical protein VLE74_02615 [Candidatus Saccharimonadales bacterium]|nr:hypothetical protein [Candidatus Saccharimonadales bacterium]